MSRRAWWHHKYKLSTQSEWYWKCAESRKSQETQEPVQINKCIRIKLGVPRKIWQCAESKRKWCSEVSVYLERLIWSPNTSVPYVGVNFHKTWTADAVRTILGRFGPWAVPHPWNPYRLYSHLICIHLHRAKNKLFCYGEIGMSDCRFEIYTEFYGVFISYIKIGQAVLVPRITDFR